MKKFIEVVPAYGRTYKNQAEVKAAWKAGFDFCDTFTRQYVNREDAERQGLSVIVRYGDLSKGGKLVGV